MAHRVTPEIEEQINEMYALCNNVKEVAAAVGFSESTVRKYIRKDYKLTSTAAVPQKIVIEFPSIEETITMLQESDGLSKLTNEETAALNVLKKRMII